MADVAERGKRAVIGQLQTLSLKFQFLEKNIGIFSVLMYGSEKSFVAY
jgi:hypothetical protein